MTLSDIAIRDLHRGASNTICIGEKRLGPIETNYTVGGHIWLSGISDSLGGFEGITVNDVRVIAGQEIGNSLTPTVIDSGRYWWLWDYRDALYNHATTPNEALPSLLLTSSNNRNGQLEGGLIGASSNHPGLVNSGFADGSCRQFNDQVDLKIWAELALRE